MHTGGGAAAGPAGAVAARTRVEPNPSRFELGFEPGSDGEAPACVLSRAVPGKSESFPSPFRVLSGSKSESILDLMPPQALNY